MTLVVLEHEVRDRGKITTEPSHMFLQMGNDEIIKVGINQNIFKLIADANLEESSEKEFSYNKIYSSDTNTYVRCIVRGTTGGMKFYDPFVVWVRKDHYRIVDDTVRNMEVGIEYHINSFKKFVKNVETVTGEKICTQTLIGM